MLWTECLYPSKIYMKTLLLNVMLLGGGPLGGN